VVEISPANLLDLRIPLIIKHIIAALGIVTRVGGWEEEVTENPVNTLSTSPPYEQVFQARKRAPISNLAKKGSGKVKCNQPNHPTREHVMR